MITTTLNHLTQTAVGCNVGIKNLMATSRWSRFEDDLLQS